MADPEEEFRAAVLAGEAAQAAETAMAQAGCEGLEHAVAEAGSGDSFLHVAAALGASGAVVQALIAAGCAVQAKDREAGRTPLHVAAAAGELATCQALVAAGADALLRNGRGRTPRQQAGVPPVVADFLVEAEEASRQRKAAVWGSALQGTQTQSACRMGCV